MLLKTAWGQKLPLGARRRVIPLRFQQQTFAQPIETAHSCHEPTSQCSKLEPTRSSSARSSSENETLKAERLGLLRFMTC